VFIAQLIALLAIPPVLGWLVWRQHQTERLIMATLIERLGSIETSLDEASTELTNELAKLREQLGNVITPEAEAIIARLEAKSKALADVIPNA
jgi:predicted negative regulator of RcsB-dependent stress response